MPNLHDQSPADHEGSDLRQDQRKEFDTGSGSGGAGSPKHISDKCDDGI